MRYLAYLALSLSLASCSIVSSTPVLNDVLASKGDTRPFETPLPVNTAHKRLALGVVLRPLALKKMGQYGVGDVECWGA